MADLGENSIKNSRISLSRNAPIALVVGAAGFVGSHLVDKLLGKNIQVIGIDDFSTGKKEYLKDALENKKFHLISQSIDLPLNYELPRLDYAFFVANCPQTGSFFLKRQKLFHQGIDNFLRFVKEFKPKIVLGSSIKLYDSDPPSYLETLKSAEINLAKYAKENHLNARIVRLAPIFGPRMHFNEDEPVIRLIQASLLNELQKEHTSLDFSTRALYIDDAVDLLIRSVFYGSTAQKIYDGAQLEPIQVTEVKQILLDPLWYEERGFEPTEIPPWLTPNLKKTSKELSWKPKVGIVKALKQTITFFKENENLVPKLKVEELEKEARHWQKEYPEAEEQVATRPESSKELEEMKKDWQEKKSREEPKRRAKDRVVFLLILGLIAYALIFPVVSLSLGAFSIRQNLKDSASLIQQGNFNEAASRVNQAESTLNQMEGLVGSLSIFKRLNILNSQIDNLDQLLSIMSVGVEGVSHATAGTQALYQTTKVVSGEDPSDPKPLFNKAQLELSTASDQIQQVQAKLGDDSFVNNMPTFAKDRVADFQSKLKFYSDLVDKARVASTILPDLTAVDGKKSYLVLLENNLELRGSGGFIGSYARLDFEGGRLRNITVDDIYNLDGQLKEHVEPPPEIKSDLGQKDFFLRDSNFEPDFPTAARQAEFFYGKEAGQRVNGVFEMDLTASGKLLDAVGGLDLIDYKEHVDGSNLFQKAISHAEVGFFPGSQAKKNYLTSLENQLFNKIFFVSKQNWPAIIQAISGSLTEKHMLVYLDDPQLFSYVTGESWGGALSRPLPDTAGQTNDFLAAVDTNLGANKANYYLQRNFNLQTSIGKDGQVFHHLQISYTNSSPSDVFPAGTYKNRFRIYLPLGTTLSKATFGETDMTKQATTFSDYGRTGYEMLIPVAPKESKTLTLDYQLPKPLSFAAVSGGNKASYQLEVFKQAGTDKDPFSWDLTYPINMSLTSVGGEDMTSAQQEYKVNTDLQFDRTFSVNFSK